MAVGSIHALCICITAITEVMEKEHLLGKTWEELQAVVAEAGMPRFAARQMAAWLYDKRVTDLAEMTNLSLRHREQLSQRYGVGRSLPMQSQRSVDGTIKYLFRVGDNDFVETVYIPDRDRATLCVSSQVGCKMNCSFCMTGKQGFRRNLTSAEIINQILSVEHSDQLTNLVFMGMGEPFDNLDEVMKALTILTAEWGFAWSPKRITVSTIGHLAGIRRFLDESHCHLAVSLHSPYPAERLQIMPVEKAFHMDDILELLRQYDFSHQRRLSFEYILFSGFNDDLVHADALARRLKGLDCRVNLIRFHAIPGVNLKSSDPRSMEAFRDRLNHHGVTATIRASRGEDIFAACGMLSTAEKERK